VGIIVINGTSIRKILSHDVEIGPQIKSLHDSVIYVSFILWFCNSEMFETEKLGEYWVDDRSNFDRRQIEN
jgi:hypothetical protein